MRSPSFQPRRLEESGQAGSRNKVSKSPLRSLCKKHSPLLWMQNVFAAEFLQQRHVAPWQSRRCVCIRCEAVGLSPHDAQRYVCNHCGKEYGHKKFGRSVLKHFKTQGRTTKLCCRQCKTESTSSSPADRLRRKASATSTLHCVGCNTYLRQSSFSKDMWHHGRHNGQ